MKLTRTVTAQLVAFATITVAGVSYVGAEYAGLADRLMDRGYTVRARFADSGGIFKGAEVTYRGVPVGRVGALKLSGPDGVAVEMRLDDGPRIPSDSLAVVASRSAVGEQHVDLQPRTAAGPYLKDGSTIARRDTRVPLPTTEMIRSLDRLTNSVGKKDLRVTVDELGKAFAGTGPHLGRTIDSGDKLIKAATASLPQTVSLIENSETVLKTQVDKGSAIKSFSRDLALLSGEVKSGDGDFRKLLKNGRTAAPQIDSLIRANESALPLLFGNLISGGQITSARLPGMEQLLVAFPLTVAGSKTVVPGDGTTHFGLVVNADDPPACRQGYEGTERRDPSDTSERPANTDARCTAPRGSGTNVRGAQNSPRPSGAGGTGGGTADRTAAQVSPYDPETGAVRGPDGRTVRIGTSGGGQSMFGKDSWQWLLVGPMA
ncbi:MCE family protein [Streptomyces sp. WMMB 322]|uniref:MCE family protein n=1 Tax=Streptomyces sp. WMMB 322 TaxID=1286821 RepID=UPI0006E23E0B|nr:MlaD family protein [Streptomyces sp. WMMB 322]SCK27886.1 phospholipid/cholesterol/gamma-HCH transport system substrate-binding protein [Streptomyces sp. WMMB 322]